MLDILIRVDSFPPKIVFLVFRVIPDFKLRLSAYLDGIVIIIKGRFVNIRHTNIREISGYWFYQAPIGTMPENNR